MRWNPQVLTRQISAISLIILTILSCGRTKEEPATKKAQDLESSISSSAVTAEGENQTLLSLPDEVQSMVRAGALSAGHARALITSHDALGLAKIVVGKGLSVRETEKLVRKITPSRQTRNSHRTEKDADTVALESDLSASLQMVVSIQHEGGSEAGKITVSYKNLTELDALCQALSMVRRDILAR